MKSKAHYKKCVELGVTPVPTSVCDENIDKEAIARLVAGGGNADDSSDEDEESEVEESDESGSEEQEAAQSLLSLSQRSSSRIPGLLPSGRPTTYPYTLSLACGTSSSSLSPCSSVGTTTTTTTTTAMTSPSLSMNVTTTATTIMTSELLSTRYYFPSTRSSLVEERRDSVIRSSRSGEDSDMEIEETPESETRASAQPMDLTTSSKTSSQIIANPRPRSNDILTPVSEPVLMQTIVQTMERLPLQSTREWKTDADGQMLQAYLTERHVMDSKMKQQYRVGNTKLDKQTHEDNCGKKVNFINSRNTDSSSTPTVTYTNPTRLQQTCLESRIKNIPKQHTSEDIKMEIRDKIYQHNGVAVERRPFDIESLHNDKDNRHDSSDPRIFNPAASRPNEHHLIVTKNSLERSNFLIEAGRTTPGCLDRQSPRNFNSDINNRMFSGSQPTKNDIDRDSVFKNIVDLERTRESSIKDYREVRPRDSPPETRILSSPGSRSHENGNSRPPSREMRNSATDYRAPTSYHDLTSRSSSQEFKLPPQELRPPSREFKSPLSDSRTPELSNIAVEQQRRSSVNDVRSPNRDQRPDHRTPHDIPRTNFAAPTNLIHETNKLHDISRIQASIETRNSELAEIKRHEMERTKQSISESVKHTVARKMVVGGPGFRSPSPPGGSNKPQAEFLQPSSGPAPNYVR